MSVPSLELYNPLSLLLLPPTLLSKQQHTNLLVSDLSNKRMDKRTDLSNERMDERTDLSNQRTDKRTDLSNERTSTGERTNEQ